MLRSRCRIIRRTNWITISHPTTLLHDADCPSFPIGNKILDTPDIDVIDSPLATPGAKNLALHHQQNQDYMEWLNAVAMNDDATVVFSAALDSTVRAWDLKSISFNPLQIMNEAQDSATFLAITDHEILTGSADSRIRRYGLRTGQMLTDFMGVTGTCVNFTQDNQCILVSSLDLTVRLLDKDCGELLADFADHKNDEYKIDS